MPAGGEGWLRRGCASLCEHGSDHLADASAGGKERPTAVKADDASRSSAFPIWEVARTAAAVCVRPVETLPAPLTACRASLFPFAMINAQAWPDGASAVSVSTAANATSQLQ
jgi:hypothetical protein